ncbi:hypothetical protein M4I17_04635 [Enterococcus thailandicus]|uniref:hypothetical protein n=1 Tax=Enterococcus thailandicus TaxID=417368 RepID=UPI002542C967|nr:hypothetical protein [Enterococcus thailandicus]MDK4351695.1 hypothetical protein [Enterococcus thailandicus]
MRKKISVVTGAHPTTKQERIKETIQLTLLLIIFLAVTTWLLHLTDGWLVLIVWGISLLVYATLLYDTWNRQTTEERKIVDNPVSKL